MALWLISKSSSKKTALSIAYATTHQNQDIIPLLLDAGADFNYKVLDFVQLNNFISTRNLHVPIIPIEL